MRSYAELQLSTNYSFLRGASHPAEMVKAAKELGYAAIGISDRNTLAGVVRAHLAAKEHQIRLLVGARIDFADDTPSMLCYPKSRAGYAKLSKLLTLGKRRAEKGECLLVFDDLKDYVHEQNWIVLDCDHQRIKKVKDLQANLYLAAQFLYTPDAAKRLHQLHELSLQHNIPLVATNDVHAHTKRRRVMQDVLTSIRELTNVFDAGFKLHSNAERYLKSPEEMHRLFARYPHAIDNALVIAESCKFSLDELKYEYPDEPVPAGRSDHAYLRELAFVGADKRYPQGVPPKVTALIEYELKIINQLKYARYFLTVYDIVKFAQDRGILCQGRGSAANSAVCYCIGITAVDPSKHDLLFERFISPERDEPPDIDVDFEHERREEVIQYIYQRFGRDKAGIAATVITYRKKSAIRDVGKALGVPLEAVEEVLVALKGYSFSELMSSREEVDDEALPKEITDILGTAGIDAQDHRIRLMLLVAHELLSFPRHLGQHVGGFVITKHPLCELVPIGNAVMDDRTFIEWDKNDLDVMGMLKIDVLALGMLSCIRRAFDLINAYEQKSPLTLATVPAEDPRVYDMLCNADSVGVFQVESRAQMSMLPRLKPREFYDLVIEVAIVRPGPIQGDMVHPYLRRRNGEEKVEYPSQALKHVLGKTLGVPLFQEQAMRIAVVAAGFSPSQADALRRAMATFRHSGVIYKFQGRFTEGMINNGYTPEFAERCFNQILGFGEYGFPESHAASFALLVYVSAWLKCHYPAAFACALLNSQPMGFYAPAQILDDAKRHGVKVLPVDVNESDYDNKLTDPNTIRIGFREIKGIKLEDAKWIVACRGLKEGASRYNSVEQLTKRTGLGKRSLELLAKADAFASIALSRRQALWSAKAFDNHPLPLLAYIQNPDDDVTLPNMSELEHVTQDYHSLSFSLRRHPIGFLREKLSRMGYMHNNALRALPHKTRVKIAGLVIIRQRPGTAKGVIFQTLEDETGFANIVIWPSVFEQFRYETLTAPILSIEGVLERKDNVAHVIAQKLIDISGQLHELSMSSRDFR
jgi:error-prone DNA polymerase